MLKLQYHASSCESRTEKSRYNPINTAARHRWISRSGVHICQHARLLIRESQVPGQGRSAKRLALRELEALASARLSGFLALLLTWITRQTATVLEYFPQRFVGKGQCASYTVSQCSRLSCNAAAIELRANVKLFKSICQLHRLLYVAQDCL